MTLFGALVGGGVGFASHCLSNSIQKVPLSRQPWKHVGMFIIGAWAGNKYQALEKQLVEDVNAMRAAKGLSPLVGSNSYFKYQAAEE